MSFKTNFHQSYEEFVAARKSAIGGSDIASVVNAGRYGCSRKLFYDKMDFPKDFPDEDKPEFRRGRRLEGIGAAYYEELTGRTVKYTTPCAFPGRPHLRVNIDRIIIDPNRTEHGVLEIKTVGRWSFNKIKKEGLIDDYSLQLQFCMAVSGRSWGAFAIYAPEQDELLHWDVEYDPELGELLLEKADDWWNFHHECGVLPDPLPETSPQCEGCAWSLTCHQKVIPVGAGQTFDRPDLESLLAKFAEVKGLGSEAKQAEEELKAEIREKIKEVPGTYVCGKFEFKFTVTDQNKFSSKALQKKYPEIYEECREKSSVKTLYKPRER
jgi:predicted phage-related endonuclease